MKGLVLKGVGGHYTVKTKKGIFICEPRGKLKLDQKRLIVGDFVNVEKVQAKDSNGVIDRIYPRKTQLFRPLVANVSQCLIVFAVTHPDPQFQLLDKLLLLTESKGLKTTICFNKIDIADEKMAELLKEKYEKVGYNVLLTSVKDHIGRDQLIDVLKDEITVLAGPSGVGKSSLLNMVQPNFELRIGQVSKKNKRGRHTTRHTELMSLNSGGWVVDTPGFMTLELSFLEKEEIKEYFIEFKRQASNCKFNNCLHLDEPGCYIKKQVDSGLIDESRYQSYQSFIKEVEDNRRF